MREFLNSRKYTITDLREIAARMGVILPSKATKLSIVEYIVVGIDNAHTEALDIVAEDIAAEWDAESHEFSLNYVREPKSFTDRMDSRIRGYEFQRNGGKLTAKQTRRLAKKWNSEHAKTVRSLALAVKSFV